MDKSAPYSDPVRPPHNTNDILPFILPSPEVSTSCDQSITVAKERGFSVQFSALLNINLSRTEQEIRRLESELMKKYTLQNPGIYYEQLMQNEHYAQDARDLLASTKAGHAYFITGFITASETTWTIGKTMGSGGAFDTTVPVGQACGLPDGGLLGVSFGTNKLINNSCSHTRHVREEQIFAVSYYTVKLSSRLKWLSHDASRTPILSGPKKAKAYHLAMGNNNDDEEIEFEWDSGDEEGSITEFKSKELESEDLMILVNDVQQILEENDGSLYLEIM